MRRHLPFIVVVGLAAMLGGAAIAQEALPPDGETNRVDNTDPDDLSRDLSDTLTFPKLGPKSAMLDLGIDLTDVPLTPLGVNTFLASLDPQAQRILLTSCAHYLTSPNSAQSQYTLEFCEVLISS
jgi:hypothetical protein